MLSLADYAQKCSADHEPSASREKIVPDGLQGLAQQNLAP